MSVTAGDRSPSVIKAVNATFTGTGTAAIWTPASGRRVVFQGCALRASPTTALAGATPGHAICIGESLASPIVSLGAIRVAADAAGVDYGLTFLDLDFGWTFAAVDTPLLLGTYTSSTIGAGVIRVVGLVWGDES